MLIANASSKVIFYGRIISGDPQPLVFMSFAALCGLKLLHLKENIKLWLEYNKKTQKNIEPICEKQGSL